jgi:hypothetical protein
MHMRRPLVVVPERAGENVVTKCAGCNQGEGDVTYSTRDGVPYGEGHPVPAPTLEADGALWHDGCKAQVEYDRYEGMRDSQPVGWGGL